MTQIDTIEHRQQVGEHPIGSEPMKMEGREGSSRKSGDQRR
jgi:hypothetical protein